MQPENVDCDRVASYLDCTNPVQIGFLAIQEVAALCLMVYQIAKICKGGIARGVVGMQWWLVTLIVVCSNAALILFVVNNCVQLGIFIMNYEDLTNINKGANLADLYMDSTWLVSLLINDSCLMMSVLWQLILNKYIEEGHSPWTGRAIIIYIIIYNVVQFSTFFFSGYEVFGLIQLILGGIFTIMSTVILLLSSVSFLNKIKFIQALQRQTGFYIKIGVLVAGAILRTVYYVYQVLVKQFGMSDFRKMSQKTDEKACSRDNVWLFSVVMCLLALIIIVLQIAVINSFFNHKQKHKRSTIEDLEASFVSADDD